MLTAQDILNETLSKGQSAFSSFTKGVGDIFGGIKAQTEKFISTPVKAPSIGKPLSSGPILPQLGQRLQQTGQDIAQGVKQAGSDFIKGFTTPEEQISQRSFGQEPSNPAQFLGEKAAILNPVTTPALVGAGIVKQGISKIPKIVKGAEEIAQAGGLTGKIKDVFSNLFGKFEPIVSQNLREARSLFKQMPSGKELANTLDKVFNKSQILEGQTVNRFQKIVKNVSDDVFSEALDFREGLIDTARPAAQAIAKQLDNIFKPIADLAQKAGLEIRLPDKTAIPFTPRENYVPHLVDVEKLKANKDLAINHLIETGQLVKDEAIALVKGMIEGKSPASILKLLRPETSPNLFGNLEFSRILDFPKEVLRRDKGLVADYIRGASRRITQATELGPQNQLLDNLLTKIGLESPSAQTIKDVAFRELGMKPQELPQKEMGTTLRSYQALTKLGTSAIANLTQSVNTATSYGIGPTVRAIIGDLKNRAISRDFAMDAGTISEAAIRDLIQEATGKGGKLLGKFTAPGFRAVEIFNRAVASNAGKNYVIKEFQKALNGAKSSISNLERMGVDTAKAIKSKSLSKEDLINAARKAVETTQFTVRPLDLPPTWTTTYGRIITQFKTFTFKQAQFVDREILRPAVVKRNLAPLIRYIVLGTIAGEVSGDIRSTISKTERPTDPLQRIIDDISKVGGVGIVGDLADAAKRGKDGILAWLAGPTVGEAGALVGGAGQLTIGKPKSLGRTLTRDIPIFGPRISKELFPTGQEKGEIKSFNFLPQFKKEEPFNIGPR